MTTQDKIKQLPDGKVVLTLLDPPIDIAIAGSTGLITDDLKALVSDLEAKTRALDTVRWIAHGHEECGEMCRLCLIEGYASGRLNPIPEAGERLQESLATAALRGETNQV